MARESDIGDGLITVKNYSCVIRIIKIIHKNSKKSKKIQVIPKKFKKLGNIQNNSEKNQIIQTIHKKFKLIQKKNIPTTPKN